MRPWNSHPRREGTRTRAARPQPATAVQGTGVGAAAWDRARRLQQTQRLPRRGGADQRYHRRCAPAAHLSSLLPGEGASWSTVASPPWPPACAPFSWPQHCRRPHAWRVALRGGTNYGTAYPWHNCPYGRHCLSSTDNSTCMRSCHRLLPAMPRCSSCCREYLPSCFIPVAYAPRPWHVTLSRMPISPLCCRRPFAYPRTRVSPAVWPGGEVPPRPTARRAPRVIGRPAEGVRP